jgi:hypothetical protein
MKSRRRVNSTVMRLLQIIKTAIILACCFSATAVGQERSVPDYSHVTITMKAEGGPCGMVCPAGDYRDGCPAYSVTLDENGTVVYNGVGCVKERGERIHSISIAHVRDLVADFLRIDFYSLKDRYTEKKLPNGMTQIIDHANATTISIDIDGKKKSVYIFYGAPDELIALQRKLYELTQIAQYTGRA